MLIWLDWLVMVAVPLLTPVLGYKCAWLCLAFHMRVGDEVQILMLLCQILTEPSPQPCEKDIFKAVYVHTPVRFIVLCCYFSVTNISQYKINHIIIH